MYAKDARNIVKQRVSEEEKKRNAQEQQKDQREVIQDAQASYGQENGRRESVPEH